MEKNMCRRKQILQRTDQIMYVIIKNASYFVSRLCIIVA